MEAVLFAGIQGSGKTTYYRQRFFETHIRISLDMLRTRTRERLLLDACLAARQPFVIDNTNVKASDRAPYIAKAKAAGFHVVGYYFRAELRDAIRRNSSRRDKKAIPVAGVIGTLRRLEAPQPQEHFDELYSVTIGPEGSFQVTSWPAAEHAPAGE